VTPRSRAGCAPPVGIEPTLPAPEAGALSTELRGQGGRRPPARPRPRRPRRRIRAALAAADLPEADPALEKPKQADHGDWATTVALRLAKPAKRNPREIAQLIVDHLELSPTSSRRSRSPGPGFVNFRFAHRYHEDLVRRVLAEGPDYGRSSQLPDDDEREHVNVEFVSANPTGPLHVGAGRWAATGDAIAALLEADRHQVTREYYVNDAGEQIRRFGESVVLVATGRS
jgi:arginyl-tRNA synthetase